MPKWGLRAGGLVVIAIGLAHFFLPTFGYDPAIPAAMDAGSGAHFFYLGTYAIGGFLIAFGIISSTHRSSRTRGQRLSSRG